MPSESYSLHSSQQLPRGPKVVWPKRAGRCNDCRNHYSAHTAMRRVNDRNICEDCAKNYRLRGGKWVLK